MRIALAQVDVDLGDIDANVARAGEVIDRARAADAELLVFPELSLSGYTIGPLEQDLGLQLDDPRIVELGRRAGPMALVLGLPEASPSTVHTYNSATLHHDGTLVHVHRKLYLPTYDIFEERKTFSPGQAIRAVDVAGTRLALLVCNDAWQPMIPFIAAQDGARLLLVPSNSAQSRFPERYDNPTYWHDLVSFNGRMQQCFVVFVNRVGQEGQLRFWGGSEVVDPWGRTIAQAGGDEQLLIVDLDLNDLRRRRREVPLLREARLGLIEREIRRLVDEGGDL